MKATEIIHRWSSALLGGTGVILDFFHISSFCSAKACFFFAFQHFFQPLRAFHVPPLYLGQGRREDEGVIETLVQGMELALMSWDDALVHGTWSLWWRGCFLVC
jgi:hypothetical protein